MTTRAVTITLELRQAGDELDGRASNGTGEDRPFTGWLGLLVAIDALLQNAEPEREQSRTSAGGEAAGSAGAQQQT
jgi:hypothetical protein